MSDATTPALNGDVLSWLNQLPLAESDLTFGEERMAFKVRIRHVDKERLQAVFKSAANGKELNQAKIREFLAVEVLCDWSGLTAGILATMAARSVGPTDAAWKQPVPFDQKTAAAVLRACNGMVEGRVVSFESWLLEQSTAIAEHQAREAAAAKNG